MGSLWCKTPTVRERERGGVHPCMVHRLCTNACTFHMTTYCQRVIQAHISKHIKTCSLRDKETILTPMFSFTHTVQHKTKRTDTQNHSDLSAVDTTQIEIRSEQVLKFQYGRIVSKYSRRAWAQLCRKANNPYIHPASWGWALHNVSHLCLM